MSALVPFISALLGAYLGFDIAFRVTAHRTREIVREEIAHDHLRAQGPMTPAFEARMRRVLNLPQLSSSPRGTEDA